MKNGKTQLIAILLSVVIALGCGLAGGVGAIYLQNKGIINLGIGKGEIADPGANNISINVSEDATIAEAIAAKVMPSVVGIKTSYQTSSYSFWGGYFNSPSVGVGTGIIVNENGYILTNAHVINDGNFNSIEVSLYDGSSAEAKALWFNEYLDLAIIKIENKGLTAAELGDSDEMNVGSYAAAIGNPLGLAFERSMSQGIISGLDREITVSSSSYNTGITMEGLFQTDATINSGNSGGPLLNSKGQVIAVNSAKASSGEGMGFAIPINVAKPIIEEIIETGHYDRPYLGISGRGLGELVGTYGEEEIMDAFGATEGIYVSSVTPGGGAEAAGIQEGDVILSLNGNKVNTYNKLNTLLIGYKPGDTVTVVALRDGQEKIFPVRLSAESVINRAEILSK